MRFSYELQQQAGAAVFSEENTPPFTEILVSWNGKRPKQGHYAFDARVDAGGWSPWLSYARWGVDFQEGGIAQQGAVQVDQDTVRIVGGAKGSGFQVRIRAENGAALSDLHRIHVWTNGRFSSSNTPPLRSCQLPIDGISQIALPDERRHRLCSPTATTAVVRFLSGNKDLCPSAFAEKVWDGASDIFGNWSLNIAEAYHQIGDQSIVCWVARLAGFHEVVASLQQGFPVVISVRSPLPRSAKTYEEGHLMVVTGFDAETEEVLCMDPAFDRDEKTTVRYDLADLLAAWERSGNIAYIFK